MQSTSESLLMQLQADGRNSDAWSRFVRLYTPLIFHWARKTGMPQHDAADLVQDVLTIVLQKLPNLEYDPERSFRGWLRMITLNRHREIERRRRIRIADPGDRRIEELPDAKLAESTWDVDYSRRLVASAMDMLQKDFAPQTWSALTLLLRSGRTAADISRETGVSVWTLYAARTRLLARLRSELKGLID